MRNYRGGRRGRALKTSPHKFFWGWKLGEAWMDGEKGRDRKRKEEREGWERSNLGGAPHCRADQS